MRKVTTLSQTQVKTHVVVKDRINPNTRQEQLIQTPLMAPEDAELKLQRKKSAVRLEVREAVHAYLLEVPGFIW